MDDWIRYLDPAAIPIDGIVIGSVGRFILVLHHDLSFIIKDPGNFDHLSMPDLLEIKSLMELSGEWSRYHRFLK